MNRYFTPTFFRFFVAFLVIIVVAIGILLYTANQAQTSQVDNFAVPQ